MTSTEYHLPALPLGQPAAEIVRWLKRPGDQLVQGEPLLLVLGERAEVLLPAPATGVLSHLLAAAGATVRPGDALASITAHTPAQAAKPAPPPSRATPMARQLASALGLDLAQLAGSGPSGAIRKADVLAAAQPATHSAGTAHPKARDERQTDQAHSATALSPEIGAAARSAVIVAEAATQGLAVMRCDFERVLAVCAKGAPAFARRGLSLDPLLCVAAVLLEALLRHPLIISRWQADCIRVPRRIDLALSRLGGVRLIENAHDLNLRGLARACARDQAPAERPGTFTLAEAPQQWWRQPTPSQCPALMVGALQARPVPVREGGAERIGVRPTALLALSYDVRLLDQRQADAFLAQVVALLVRFSAGVAGV